MTLLNLRPQFKPRKRSQRRPVWDCIGGCGRKASAWNAKDACCAHCLPRMMPTFIPPPLELDFDPADIPF